MLGSWLPWLSSATKATNQWLDFLVALGILIGVPLVILFITAVISRFARKRLRSALERTGFQVNIAILLSRILWIGIWALGVLAALKFLGLGFGPLTAFIGIVGLAASLSLQSVLQNLVAGIYLLAERPFKIGDVISVIGPSGLNHEGTVIDIQMRTTHLRSRDNDVILVPNGAIFTGVVTNRTAVGGFATQLALQLPRDNEPAEAERLAREALENVDGILTAPRARLHVDKVEAACWTGTLIFWTSTNEARSGAVWALAKAFPSGSVGEAAAT